MSLLPEHFGESFSSLPSVDVLIGHHGDAVEEEEEEELVHGQTTSPSTQPPPLSPARRFNLACLLVAFACNTVATVLIVGGSGNVILSVGGSDALTTSALAVYYAGSGSVGLLTGPIFVRLGSRKKGFLLGNLLSLLGAATGAVAVYASSPALVAVSAFPLGAACGIGYHLRYFCLEVVSEQAFHIGVVLSGGLVAAFLGPEALLLLDSVLPQYEQMALYFAIAVFPIISAVAIGMVQVDQVDQDLPNVSKNTEKQNPEEEAASQVEQAQKRSTPPPLNATTSDKPLRALIFERRFIVPAVLLMLLHFIIAMPTSLIAVVMNQTGFSVRQQILSVELSFAGQWAPGFLTGILIDGKGIYAGLSVSILLTVIGTCLLIVSGSETTATWLIGTFLLCAGWVFGFSSASVMATRCYQEESENERKRLQGLTDFVLFIGAAGMTYATGYIYAAGGSGLEGFRLVNEVVLGVILLLVVIVVTDVYADRKKDKTTASGEYELSEKRERSSTMDTDDLFADGEHTHPKKRRSPPKRQLTNDTLMSKFDDADDLFEDGEHTHPKKRRSPPKRQLTNDTLMSKFDDE